MGFRPDFLDRLKRHDPRDALHDLLVLFGPLQMDDRPSARLVKQVLDTLHAVYSAEISNGLVATMVSVETDAISIGILYEEIMMAV